MPRASFVGREPELAALATELAGAVESREVRTVVLSGEGGAGKTRLAAEFAHRTGTTVLWARAAPFGESDPLGLWAQALEGHLRGLGDDDVRHLCGGVVGDLAVLVRRVAAVAGAKTPAAPPPRRLYEAVATVLWQVGRAGPVVVVLDDIHLADASSWEALHHVTHGLRDVPVLVVATARPAELARHPGGRQVLFGLEQEGRLLRMRVGAFDEADLQALAAEAFEPSVPPALVRWLSERSRGNALLAVGLLQALVAEGGDPARPSLRRLPEDLAARVAAQLAELEAGEREAVETLAVLGGSVDPHTLAAVLGNTRPDLDRLLAAVEPTGLVTERAGGIELDHPLLAEAVREQMSPAQSRLRHRQVARTLLSAGRAGEAAPHFAFSCGGRADAEVVSALCRALHDAEERQADQETLDLLDALTRLLPSGDTAWVQVAAAMRWTPDWVVDHRADNVAAGVRALQEIARALDRSADLQLRAGVQLRLASFLAWGTGRSGEAAAACAEARGLAEQAGDARGVLLARTELAWTHVLAGRTGDMFAEATSLVAAAEEADDRFALIQACTTLGNAASFLGRFAEAEVALRRSHHLAAADGRDYEQSRVLSVLAMSLAAEGRMVEARAALDEARAAVPGLPPVWEPWVQWMAGQTEATLASVREALAFRPIGASRRRATVLNFAALAAIEAGDLATAARYVEEAEPAFGDGSVIFGSDYHGCARAALAWRLRRDPAALGLLRLAANRLTSSAPPFALPVLSLLAEIAAEAGDTDTAESAAGEAARLVSALARPFLRAHAELAAAAAATVPAQARAAARRGLDSLAELDYPGLRARLLVRMGSACGADRDTAIEALSEGARVFAAVGAHGERDRALERLRRLRGRGRRVADAILGPDALTARELDVARLACAGHTAAEIARDLFIGVRTVEGHLASIYAKLGVRSKTDLVRRAPELLP